MTGGNILVGFERVYAILHMCMKIKMYVKTRQMILAMKKVKAGLSIHFGLLYSPSMLCVSFHCLPSSW